MWKYKKYDISYEDELCDENTRIVHIGNDGFDCDFYVQPDLSNCGLSTAHHFLSMFSVDSYPHPFMARNGINVTKELVELFKVAIATCVGRTYLVYSTSVTQEDPVVELLEKLGFKKLGVFTNHVHNHKNTIWGLDTEQICDEHQDQTEYVEGED